MSNEIAHDTTDTSDVPASSGRRDFFTKAGAAAAVAAVAGLAAADRASAANSDTMQVGYPHTGTNTTSLSGGTTFRVTDGASNGSASIYGTNSGGDRYGVRGSSSGSGGIGVYGQHTGSGTQSAAVMGINTGSGHGVWGRSTDGDGAGVYGAHGSGIGVYGHYDGSTQVGVGVLGQATVGSGVVGRGSSYDLQADRSGKVGITKASTITATATGTVGTIARDADGDLWYCSATNRWEQLSGVVAPATPPQFTPIAPIRAYDSRIAAIPQSGAFTATSSKVISVKDGRDQFTGAVTTPNAIPAGATAVAFNVTATNTTAGSFLAVVPGNVTESAVSSLNWVAPGTSIANAGIVGLDGSRQVRIIAGPVGAFDAIIDITGYFS